MNLHEVCNIYGYIVAGAISSVVWGISAVVGGAKRSTRKLKEISKNLGSVRLKISLTLPILKLSISEQLLFRFIIYFLRSVLSFGSTTFNSTAMIVATTTGLFPKIVVNSFGNAASAP